MSARKATVRPKRTNQSKPSLERCEQIKDGIEAERGRMLKTNALMIAGGSTLDAGDCDLILRALDVLDRDMQTELANKGQDAAAGETRSRILIVRAKLQAMVSGPIRTEQSTQQSTQQSEPSERCEQIKDGIETELRRVHKTNALLIATQFAANHECEFDVSDAVAAIIERVDQHIETLDRLCLEVSP